MKTLRLIAAVLLALGAQPALAWSNHSLGTWQALAVMPQTQRMLEVESLEQFVTAEADKLEKFLADLEPYLQKNLPNYPALPASLAFSASGKNGSPVAARELKQRLLQALRINQAAHLNLFLQLKPDALQPSDRDPLPWQRVSVLSSGAGVKNNRYVSLREGDKVSALEVIATAADEPDYGLDIGLFSDNGTAQGAVYGFGKQSFGNPALDYSSQIPFHMGPYHESAVVYAVAGFLKRSYPEMRIEQYRKLAQFAFDTGHPYWGWRFTGWALHYAQDLTQPYHSRILPGTSTFDLLWINTKAALGFDTDKNNAVTLVSNRHLVLEEYQFARMYQAYAKQNLNDALLAALRDTNADERSNWVYQLSDTRQTVSRIAAEKADETDQLVVRSFPTRFTSEPGFEFGISTSPRDFVALHQSHADAPTQEQFTALLSERLKSFGIHSRALLRSTLGLLQKP